MPRRLFHTAIAVLAAAVACSDPHEAGSPLEPPGASPPLVSCSPSPDPLPADAAGSLAIVGATIVTMDGGRVVEDGTVLVEDGRIERVGPASDISVPSEATTIDGSCRFVMPGLADMHIHMAFTSEALVYLANGVTTVREMWGSPGHLVLRAAIAAGETLGPTMVVGSAGIRDTPFLGRTIVLTDPAEAEGVVADLVAQGFDFAKIHESIDSAVYDAVVEATRALGLELIGHAPARPGLDRVLGADQRDIEHMANAFVPLLRTGPGGWWDDPMDPIAMAVLGERLAAEGVNVTPTLATLRAMLTPAEEEAFPNRPEARFIPRQQIETWRERGPWAPSHLRTGATANQSRAARALASAGVRLMTGTDAGFTYVIPGFAIHDELEMLVEAGLTPVEALRAATANPADFMLEDGDFGRVREGLRADLLLLEADPREDVAKVRARAGIVARGRWLSEAEIQRRLEASVQAALAPATISGSPVHVEMAITNGH